MSGAGSKPPAAPSLKTFFSPWALGCVFGVLLLRHLRRPRAARGVELRRVGLRDGRAASGCAARSRRRVRTRGSFGFFGFDYFHLAYASAAVADGAANLPRRAARRTRRVGKRRTVVSACDGAAADRLAPPALQHSTSALLLRVLLLRHLQRPRATRRTRRIGLS